MPLLAVGLAATAAGTGLSIAGNKESQNAVNAARQNEVLQQQKLQQQASGVFQNSATQNSAANANSTLAAGLQSRAQIAAALKTAATGADTTLPANSQPTYQITDSNGQPAANTATTRAAGSGSAWSNVVNGAADRMGSYGDLNTTQRINNAQSSADLGVINNKAQGDANLLPLELEVASHKGDKLSGWGQIVSALGSVASMGAASGLGAASGAATAPLSWSSAVSGAGTSGWANAMGTPVPASGAATAMNDPYMGWNF